MSKKVFARLEQAETLYEQAEKCDEESIRLFGQPYRYAEAQVQRNRFLKRLGLTNILEQHAKEE